MREEHEPRLRVVLDTNVLLSALAWESSEAANILDLWERGVIRVFASPFILEELERNLARKAELSPEDARDAIAIVTTWAELIEPDIRLTGVAQKDSDNRILECAVAAEARVLITGNMRDMRPLGEFRGIRIMTPREFLDEFGKKQPRDWRDPLRAKAWCARCMSWQQHNEACCPSPRKPPS